MGTQGLEGRRLHFPNHNLFTIVMRRRARNSEAFDIDLELTEGGSVVLRVVYEELLTRQREIYANVQQIWPGTVRNHHFVIYNKYLTWCVTKTQNVSNASSRRTTRHTSVYRVPNELPPARQKRFLGIPGTVFTVCHFAHFYLQHTSLACACGAATQYTSLQLCNFVYTQEFSIRGIAFIDSVVPFTLVLTVEWSTHFNMLRSI